MSVAGWLFWRLGRGPENWSYELREILALFARSGMASGLRRLRCFDTLP